MEHFLEAGAYIDYHSACIQQTAGELFSQAMTDEQKARTAYKFVRDEIPHSFDINAAVVTAKASDVLRHKTGICHAKANLLAALLRTQGIPAGFCFQHITLADDERRGYCLHAYNAVFLGGKWIKIDARGNTGRIDAQFSLGEPKLAFVNRTKYKEYTYKGIFAEPDANTMELLARSKTLLEMLVGLPDTLSISPRISE